MSSKGDDRFDKKVDALEMEMLLPSSTSISAGASQLSRRIHQMITLGRVYAEVYPRITRAAATVFGMIFIKVLFFRHHGQALYVPPHLSNHYGDVQSYYDLQISKIDHWCLRGGNEGCQCDDPTEELSREEVPGWVSTFELNKQTAREAPRNLDVVFLGDEFVQAWTGKNLKSPFLGGKQIEKCFNQTFQKQRGGSLDGIALGISGDSTANLLFRVQNDEMPKSLMPKVWWLLIGANDLVRGQCSEEAVVVGILRLADEISMKRPGSIVVIQGLLPRSSFADGALSHTHTESKSLHYRPHRKEYFKTGHYPLWPSIKVINAELERFCEKHEHMVYFDASRLFFGNLGNEYFQSSDSTLLKELYMSDFAHPSVQGYRILAKVMGKELNRIIYDNDEDNHKATANEER